MAMRFHGNRFRYWALSGAFLSLASAASGATYSVLYNFAGGTSDGANPYGSLTLSGTTLYGMTSAGGSKSDGTIFAFDPATSTESVAYSFGSQTGDGTNPEGSLVLSGSDFYGMTDNGGGNREGTIFSFNPANNSEAPLHSFAGGSTDGNGPLYGSLVQSGTNLYGTTRGGGIAGQGVVFSFFPSTAETTVLYSFGEVGNDGINPGSGLVLSGSTLYGLTEFGGTNSGPFSTGVSTEGALVSFNPANNSERVLHDFGSSATDGTFPQGALIQSGGVLYGYGQNGGANGKGTIFSYNTQTSAYATLYSFDPPGSSDGSIPYGDLLLDGTTLYGMTRLGGAHSSDGEIFSFDTSTGDYTILHSFDGTDGGSPYGSLMLDGSTLYGMTETGGTHTDGVIFSVSLPEPGTLALLAVAASGLLVRRRRQSSL